MPPQPPQPPQPSQPPQPPGQPTSPKAAHQHAADTTEEAKADSAEDSEDSESSPPASKRRQVSTPVQFQLTRITERKIVADWPQIQAAKFSQAKNWIIELHKYLNSRLRQLGDVCVYCDEPQLVAGTMPLHADYLITKLGSKSPSIIHSTSLTSLLQAAQMQCIAIFICGWCYIVLHVDAVVAMLVAMSGYILPHQCNRQLNHADLCHTMPWGNNRACNLSAGLQVQSLLPVRSPCAGIRLTSLALELLWLPYTKNQWWLTCSYPWQQKRQAIPTQNTDSAFLHVPTLPAILYAVPREQPMLPTLMKAWVSNGQSYNRYFMSHACATFFIGHAAVT